MNHNLISSKASLVHSLLFIVISFNPLLLKIAKNDSGFIDAMIQAKNRSRLISFIDWAVIKFANIEAK